MAPISTQNGISFSSSCGTRNSEVSATTIAEAVTSPEVLRTISM
jgi:hypothetical protein